MTDETRGTRTSTRGAPRTSGNGDIQRISAELERTRAEMEGTLHALEDTLSPNRLMDTATQYLREGAPADYVRNLGGAISQNPIPATLTGIGLAWLMYNSRYPVERGAVYEEGDYAMGMGYSSGSSYRASIREKGYAMGMRAHQLGERMRSAQEGVSARAGRMRRMMGRMGGGMRGGASDVAGRSRRQAERARESYSYMVDEHPFLLGMIGVAIGAGLAAAFPGTRTEDQLMGRARDRAVESAEELGHEGAARAQRVAEAAGEAARTEAERQGASSGR